MANESSQGPRKQDDHVALRIARGKPDDEEVAVLLLALRAVRPVLEQASACRPVAPVPPWRRAVSRAPSAADYRGRHSGI